MCDLCSEDPTERLAAKQRLHEQADQHIAFANRLRSLASDTTLPHGDMAWARAGATFAPEGE